jgi:hypothetical protein
MQQKTTCIPQAHAECYVRKGNKTMTTELLDLLIDLESSIHIKSLSRSKEKFDE